MLKIENLTKRYGSHTVVDDLSFCCAPGEVLGFLGPNGAGKSTTMKMVTGFVSPTVGCISVCGHDIDQAPLEARRCIGYLPEGAPCYPEMTPRSFLEFVADIRHLTGTDRNTRLDSVIEALHLAPVLNQSIDTLSKGFKRRVGLAQAIIHDPEVLILDEPTASMDPASEKRLLKRLETLCENKTTFLITHKATLLSMVDKVILMDKGRIVAFGPRDEIIKGLQERRYGTQAENTDV